MKLKKIVKTLLALGLTMGMSITGFAQGIAEQDLELVDVPMPRTTDVAEAYIIDSEGNKTQVPVEVKLQKILKRNGEPVDGEQYVLTGSVSTKQIATRGSDSGRDTARTLDASINAAIYFDRSYISGNLNNHYVLNGADASFYCGQNVVMSKNIQLRCGQSGSWSLGYNQNSFSKQGLNWRGVRAYGTFNSDVEGPGAREQLVLNLMSPSI